MFLPRMLLSFTKVRRLEGVGVGRVGLKSITLFGHLFLKYLFKIQVELSRKPQSEVWVR